MRWLFSLILLWVAGVVSALSATGNRLLVVLEENSEKEKYSELWKDLGHRGYHLTFESPKAESLSLFRLGERAFDHILLLPPKSKAYGPALTPNVLLDFINAEGNILLGLSANTPTPNGIVSLLLELDIHLPADRTALVVDHFNYDIKTATENHDVVLVQPPKPLRSDVKNYFDGDKPIAVPRAVAQALGNTNPLLVPILRAPSTAYVHSPKDASETAEDIFASGQQIALVSALQARNSARFTVLGSIEALQDEWFRASVKVGDKESKTGNQRFAQQVTGWTFKELGVLKVSELHHHLNEGPSKGRYNESAYPPSQLNPKIYRIKNDVTYTIALSEWASTHWTPYVPPATDAVQLEFTMLSPFHRLNLTALPGAIPNETLYSTTFTLPDQHGIFHFRVNYKRPFLTNIDEKRQVTVRHFAHDEWPRSFAISAAWVWVAGVWSVVVAFIAFIAVWLWSAPVERDSGKKRM